MAESVRVRKNAGISSADAIAEQRQETESSDILLVMSNGSFGGHEKLLAKLGKPLQVSSEANTR